MSGFDGATRNEALTVAQLKKAIADLPDNMPIRVSTGKDGSEFASGIEVWWDGSGPILPSSALVICGG